MAPVNQWFGGSPDRKRVEPHFESAVKFPKGGMLHRPPGALKRPKVQVLENRERLKELGHRYDVRSISPREMVSLSLELYVAGLLTKEQYDDLSFQPELLPSYDRTVGALIGETAEPDQPRDYTEIWRQRLAFEARHYADEPRVIARTRNILDLLKSL